MYSLKFLPEAEEDLGKLKRNEPKALRGDKAGQWSRRISSKHRLVYARAAIVRSVSVD